MSIASMNSVAVAIENIDTGYDQNSRYSFWPSRSASGALVSNQECDCSSSCHAILTLGGYGGSPNDWITTRNWDDFATSHGFKRLGFSLSKVTPGDFLWRTGHVAYCYSPGMFFSASWDENGNAVGGNDGDNSGKEVRLRKAYSGGFTRIYRPSDSDGSGGGAGDVWIDESTGEEQPGPEYGGRPTNSDGSLAVESYIMKIADNMLMLSISGSSKKIVYTKTIGGVWIPANGEGLSNE